MRIRRLSGALIAGLLLIGPRPLAAASDVFTVRGIEVDVTAETAAAAREAALAQGHVLALQKLLTRILPRDELARVRRLEADEIVQFVQDFEVAEERRSDVRYLASLTFRFKPEPLRQLLRADGLLYAETRSKPVLVLPVFGIAGQAKLWGETNPWWQAWAMRRPGDWLVPLRMPLGDLGDISTIDAEQTLSGDTERLSKLARRYGAEDVIITQAVLLGDPEAGQASLQIGTSRLGVQERQTIIENHHQQAGESLAALFSRAAEAVDREVQESWKQSNLLRAGSERKLSATVPVGRLADWLEVKRRLEAVAPVVRSEVTGLSRSRTEVDITFVGDEQQLVLAMAQSDLTLSLNPAVGWEIRLSGAQGETDAASGLAPIPDAPSAAAAGAGRQAPSPDGVTTAPAETTPVVE
ncbi:MAG: DUF2066 domain-containing protein [Kiloniellaceae bacterium]